MYLVEIAAAACDSNAVIRSFLKIFCYVLASFLKFVRVAICVDHLFSRTFSPIGNCSNIWQIWPSGEAFATNVKTDTTTFELCPLGFPLLKKALRIIVPMPTAIFSDDFRAGSS